MGERKSENFKYGKRAFLLVLLLLLIAVISIVFIALGLQKKGQQLTAHIYQNGVLLESIDLSAVTEEYSFTVTGTHGESNTITVAPGSIGITDANCPDRLCVSMGYQSTSLLPIICLPHKLVISLEETKNGPSSLDSITY